MGESVKLRIEFDDSKIKTGLGRVRQQLGDGDGGGAGGATGGGRGGAGRGRGGGGGDGGTVADRSVLQGFLAQQMSSISRSVTDQLVQAFDPFKTNLQKQESMIRAGMQLQGSVGGLMAGSVIEKELGIEGAGIVGAQVGGDVGRLGAEAFFQQPDVARARYANEQASQMAQQEAMTRLRMTGEQAPQGELDRFVKQLLTGMEQMFDARMAAMQAVNNVSPDVLGIIAGQAQAAGRHLGASARQAVNEAVLGRDEG